MRLADALVFTFLDSFRNKSGKPQPVWTKVGIHAHVKGRQRSRNFGRHRLSGGEMGGSKVSPTRELFFVSNTRWLFSNFATADFHQIWPWHVNRGWNADFWTKIYEKFPFRGHFPQNSKLWGVKQVPHLAQATGQGMHCSAEILFTPRCSTRAREFPGSGQLFCTTYTFWVKLCQGQRNRIRKKSNRRQTSAAT